MPLHKVKGKRFCRGESVRVVPLVVKSKEFLKMVHLYCSIYQAQTHDINVHMYRHSTYPNFEGYLLLDEKDVVGYVYGYTSKAGQYYHDLLFDHLGTKRNWLSSCMELAELGLHPQYRKKGWAQKLMSALLENRSEKHAVLTVRQPNYQAISFYEKHGWFKLQEGFYPNVSQEYIIMGKTLR